MAAGGIFRYTFTGEDGEVVPRDATHITIDKSVKVIPRDAFLQHPNIEEFECHDGVETIKHAVFYRCPSLRRVKMPGVKVVEAGAFNGCKALADVDCDKLERIGSYAFYNCPSLRSINLPSVKTVQRCAFHCCTGLTGVKFEDKLESIGGQAFVDCTSLEHISLPLKDGLIAADDDDYVFTGCENLKHVDLVGGMHETITALHLEDWRNDMNAAIDAINKILPDTTVGRLTTIEGGKGQAVIEWIGSVLHKLVGYKAQHRNLLTEAATALVEDLSLPQDIVMKHVLPLLELPPYTFEVER
jgi:hypothetical protein